MRKDQKRKIRSRIRKKPNPNYKKQQYEYAIDLCSDLRELSESLEDPDQRRELKRLSRCMSHVITVISKSNTGGKSLQPQDFDVYHSVYVVEWIEQDDDPRDPPAPMLILNLGDLAEAVNLSKTSTNKYTRNYKKHLKTTMTIDPRLPEEYAFKSPVWIQRFADTEESVARLIELGFESRLDEIRYAWLPEVRRVPPEPDEDKK